MFVPITSAMVLSGICFLLTLVRINKVFISPETDSIGYNFLSYVFGDALTFSTIWQRHSSKNDKIGAKIHANLRTITDQQ